MRRPGVWGALELQLRIPAAERFLLIYSHWIRRRTNDGQGNSVRLRHRRRCRSGLAGQLWRRGFARRYFARPVRRRGRQPAAAQDVRAARHQDDVVHSRPLDRDVSQGDEGGGRRRPRDRHPRLQPREPDRHDARAGDRDPRQVHRSGDQAFGQAADRLRGAMVGVLDRDQRAPARARHQVRPLAHAQRSPALLCAGGRSLDQDRLCQEAARMDGAAASAARRPT